MRLLPVAVTNLSYALASDSVKFRLHLAFPNVTIGSYATQIFCCTRRCLPLSMVLAFSSKSARESQEFRYERKMYIASSRVWRRWRTYVELRQY